MSKNEKITERLFCNLMREVGILENDNFLFEEQKSENPQIQKLLKSGGSKSGDGIGKPEFIITAKNKDKDFLIVVECKAENKYHISTDKDNINNARDYAVDGVLFYSSSLSRGYNVVSIAVSGQSLNDFKISTYFQAKGSEKAELLKDENGKDIENVLNWGRYIERAKFDPDVAKARHEDLLEFSRELNNYLRDYAKITEGEKPLLVSGILLALMDEVFLAAYLKCEGQELATLCFDSIKKVINKAELGDTADTKKKAIFSTFSFIEHHPELKRYDEKRNESPLLHVIKDLDLHVKPFTKDYYDFDIIGDFYGEFIRYTGGDGKGLGIVLTPKHITDLFADIANLDKNSVVLDTCAGTAGFLISAMKKMTENTSADEKRKILTENLIGIEQEPKMFALAVSNMILRGDGKTNLYQGSCFDDKVFDKIKGKASAGFINPPYSQKGDNLHEWDFIIRMLSGLSKNGTGVAIVPMSLAIDTKNPLREKLLKEHRLEAVMSMPDDLFYPVGVVSCIMVFTAHTPHDSNQHHESWFGYWKNDGFRKDKVKGRIPKSKELWKSIKDEWVEMYRRREIAGKSVWKKVTKDDEWTVEAYLETDYNSIVQEDFIKTAIEYTAMEFKNGNTDLVEILIKNKNKSLDRNFNISNWKVFELDDLFDFEKGKCGSAEKLLEKGDEISYVGAKKEENGFMYKVVRDESFVTKGGCIVFICDGQGSVGYSTFQEKDFIGSTTLAMGRNKELNKYNALFLITLLDKERFKYSFGRKWSGDKLKKTQIKLPVTKDGGPDWQYMEDYIKSLPYSASI